MEKIFATVISLAIMVALVVGVVSILRSNNSKGDNRQNYIDLNEINEALSESGQSTQRQAEGMEEQSNVAKNDEKDDKSIKNDDEKNTTKDNDNSIVPSEDSIKDRDTDVAKNTDNKGQKNTENAIENETTQSRPDKDENVDSDDKAEVGATAADSEMPETESMQETVQTAEGETIENQENIGDTTPVNASTATILGYSFNEESTMMWPASGDVILNYNMSNTIYFPTLDVYRCNPAIVISAPEDSVVCAAADGIVISVYETNETGLTMEVALGNDYVMTYGQLKDVKVGVGSQVKRGDALAAVAAPSQYYTVEGSNLYFKLEKAGESVNPMDFIDAE